MTSLEEGLKKTIEWYISTKQTKGTKQTRQTRLLDCKT
jgi:dTDP-D-glucose 4,6-dehydratase